MPKQILAAKVHDRTTMDLPINSVVAIDIVADPYSDCGEKIQVIRSTRDDPLAGMRARDYIDDAQLAAGRKWQMLHERSTVGCIRAIDPTKEAVDGGAIRDMLTDPQIEAFKELADAFKTLEPLVNSIIFYVLAERNNIQQTADKLGYHTRHGRDKVSDYFKGGLEQLAGLWGFAGEAR